MVHALLDVVPVGSDQFMVVVDLQLPRSNETVSKTRRKRPDKRKRGRTLYLAEEVADDGVGQGVGQAAELRGGGHKRGSVSSPVPQFRTLFKCRVRVLPCVRPSSSIPQHRG